MSICVLIYYMFEEKLRVTIERKKLNIIFQCPSGSSVEFEVLWSKAGQQTVGKPVLKLA